MGDGEQDDGRPERPMALPGRGEIRTRRGAEVTVGAEGRRRELGRGGVPVPVGVSVPVGWRGLARAFACPPRRQRGPEGCAGSRASQGPSEGRGARFPEVDIFAPAPLSRGR